MVRSTKSDFRGDAAIAGRCRLALRSSTLLVLESDDPLPFEELFLPFVEVAQAQLADAEEVTFQPKC